MSFPDQVSRLFAQALEISDESERQAFIKQHCHGNPEHEFNLLQMLRVHRQASGFLSQPPGAQISGTEHGMYVGRESVVNKLSSRFDLRDSDEESTTVRESSLTGKVGRYQLHGEIARGGMGAILKGRDVDLGRNLAIKVLLESHGDQPAIVERFIEEAQIGGQLQHPGIAPVYELGTLPDKRPFFSMKLVKGQTLAAMLSDRNDAETDRSKLLGIFEQVCQTMAYAHSRRVIHRDLKPANIMVGAFGEVQVMDWGLAKVLKVGGIADEKRARDTQLGQSLIQTVRSGSNTPQGTIGTKKSSGSSGASETHAGSVMGTPAYMPPEQALGEVNRLDERCDVFGLGAILCEILTGKPPYVAEDSQDLFRKAARGKMDDAHERLDNCGTDPQLVELAKQSIQPEVEDRIRSAGELSKQLTGYLESVETRLREAEVDRAAEATRATEQRKRRRVSTALAVSVVLLFAMCGVGLMGMQIQASEQAQAKADQFRGHVNDAKLHRDLADSDNLEERSAELEKAIVSAKQASALAEGEDIPKTTKKEIKQLLATLESDVESVKKQLSQRSKDQRTKDQLEFTRLSHASGGKKLRVGKESGQFGDSASEQYDQAFRDIGIPIADLSADQAAELVRQSSISPDLISGLDHWTAMVSRFTRDDVVRAAKATANWDIGIKTAREWLRREPDSHLVYMDLAVMMIMSGNEKGYKDLCQEIIDRFANPESSRNARRISKTCLLLPTERSGVDLDDLPIQMFERALDEGGTSSSLLPYAWSIRALVAYRRGRWEECLRYLEKSDEFAPTSPSRALNAVLGAMADFQTGRVDDAKEKITQLDVYLEEFRSDAIPRGSRDTLIPIILRKEAVDLIAGGIDHLDFQEWAIMEPVRQQQKVIRQARLRGKLIEIANSADPNPWRKAMRRALDDRDVDKLVELADDDETRRQPAELIAWVATELRRHDCLDEATALLKRSNEANPGDFWINYELGRSLSLLGNSSEALGFARSALAIRPTSLGAKWSLMTILEESGNQWESNQRFEQLLSESSFTEEEYKELATDLLDRGHNSKAETIARQWIKSSPDQAVAHWFHAKAYERQGNYDKAIDALRPAITLDPKKYRYHFSLAYNLGRAKRYDEAEAAYRASIQLTEDAAPALAYNNLGVLLTKLKRHQEAAEMYRKAIQYGETTYAVGNLIGLLRAERQRNGMSPEVVAELQKLSAIQARVDRRKIDDDLQELKTRPRDTVTRLQLINRLIKFRQIDDAVFHYRMALRYDDDNAELHSGFSSVLITAKQPDDALFHARKAVALDSESSRHNSILAQALWFKATGHAGRGRFNSWRGFFSPPNVGELDAEQERMLDEAIVILQDLTEAKEEDDTQQTALITGSPILLESLRLRGRLDEAETLSQKRRVWFEQKFDQWRSQPENEGQFAPGFSSSSLARQYISQTGPPSLLERVREQLGDALLSPYLAASVVLMEYEVEGDREQAIKDARVALTVREADVLQDVLAWLLVLEPDEDGKYLDLPEALDRAKVASVTPSEFPVSRTLATYRTRRGALWTFSGKNTLGMVHYRRQEFKEALAALKEFNEMGFTEPNNWLFLAMTHWQLGDREEAQRWYEKATEFLEDHPPSRDEKLILKEAELLMGKTQEGEQ